MAENKIKRKAETHNDYQMDASPTPPPRTTYNGRQTPPPYRNEAPPPKRKQETTDSEQTEPYRAPRYDGPLTQMGVHIVTAELKMNCTILVEVGETTLRDHTQDRETLEENRTETGNL